MVRKGSARIPRALALVLLVGANLLSAAKCASQNSSTGAELAETGGEQIATAAEVAKKVAVKPVSPVTDIVPDDRFLAELLPLVQDPPTQRAESLAQLVAAGSPRARYLRASDALTTGSPEVALELLDGLEEEYAVLAPFVRLQQARAWKATGNLAKVLQLQSTLDRDFPESAAAAIAACDDGRPEIPRHPCSWELARQVIARDPNNFEALLRLARYQPRDSKANEWRNRLVELHSSRLSSQDWEVIAFGYWKTWEYDKAANAYEKTPSSPESLYRIARGRHLSNRKTDARRVYLQVLRDFPEAENSGWALRRLADLSTGNEALSYLDRAIDRFPARAPEALQEKAKRLEKLGNQAAAAAARQELLRDYPETDATSDYRWERARKAWLAGNLADAITWAGPAKMAKAQFWIAKWQQQQGQTEAARAQFESVLRDYPDSYYAWRSAVFLGHNVGSFNNARRFSPPLVALEGRVPLQAGSDAVSELYLLGQDRDAYGLWQYETVAKQEDLSVAEQFTDGVLQLTQGNHLVGINQVWNLKDREEPEEQSQWLDLQQQSAYWQALYPLPFEQPIRAWSQERQLNPLLVASLIRQESRFEPLIRSRSNAMGLMQILPTTGQWIAGKIGQPSYNLDIPEDNVKFGTWYLRYTHERYGNNSMLAIASYNGGPGNVAKWLERFGLQDEDRFVEMIPFEETRGYVESVFGNYWNYLRLYSPDTIPAGAELFPR